MTLASELIHVMPSKMIIYRTVAGSIRVFVFVD